MSKTDRHSLKRADPRLQHQAAPIWKDDALYDYLVPKALQEEAQKSAPTPRGSPLSAQTWARLGHRLDQASKDRCMRGTLSHIQASQVGCVRRTAVHNIHTIVALVETSEVLTIGNMPSDAARRLSDPRRGMVFALAHAAANLGTPQRGGPQALWQGEEIAISHAWRQPQSLVTAGCGGLMATLSGEQDLRIWQYEDNALARIVFPDVRLFIKATHVAFSLWDRRCHAVFHGCYDYAFEQGPHADPDAAHEDTTQNLFAHPEAMLHGISFCPNGAISDTKYLELVRGAAPEGAAQAASHLAIDDSDHTATLVREGGEVASEGLPFSGFPAARAQSVPTRRPEHASVSASGNAVALHDAGGGVRVLRKRQALLKLVWNAPRPRTIKKMALNADGSRLGLLGSDNVLEIWPTGQEPPSTKRAPGKPVCRVGFEGRDILNFDFSPYCHALLVTLADTTHLVFPMRKPVVVELPHLGGTGVFMPGTRVVGVNASALVDIDLSRPPTAA